MPGPAATEAATASGDAMTSDGTTGAPGCAPDGFEPDDAHPQIGVGLLSLVLETADAIDRFHLYISADAPHVVQASVDVASLRVCTFLRCEDGGMPTMLACTTGLSGADAEGAQGCCGDAAVAMSFACGGDGTGKVLIEVDGGAEDCVYYGLTVAQDGG